MKNVVFNDTGRQSEFKPDAIFEKYLALTERDVKKSFTKKTLIKTDCPACRKKISVTAFEKFGFKYVECQNCKTVYIAEHPKDEYIREYCLRSSAINYWRSTLSKATVQKRKEKIYRPRLQWIGAITEEYLPKAQTIADCNNKDASYVSDLLQNNLFKYKLVVCPYFYNKELVSNKAGSKVVSIINNACDIKGTRESVDAVSAFEVLDLLADVDGFLSSVNRMLVKGGLFFLTTISISGFDLQTLWGNSQSIFPPDRINVFSREGLEILFKRHGFEIIEYSTPGILDLDIVKNAYKRNRKLDIPRFVKTLIDSEDEQLNLDFQEFLQINRLSSFARIVVKK
ncbi:MAG: methyltransferase domain-containing protein [bacterium]